MAAIPNAHDERKRDSSPPHFAALPEPATSFRQALRGVPKALWLIAAAFVAVMSYFSWARYANFQSGAFDLGVNVQLVSTARGGVPIETGDYMLTGGALGTNYLGVHFSPIVYAASPLTQVLPPVPLLVVLQWTAVALGAPVLFLLARDLGIARTHGWLLVAGYFLYVPMWMSALYDVHEMALFPLLALSFFLALRWRWYGVAGGALLVGALTQEGFLLLAPFVAGQIILDRSPRPLRLFEPWRWDRTQRIAAVFAISAVLGFAGELAFMRAVDPARGLVLFRTVGSSLSVAGPSVGLSQKLVYWSMLTGFLGFLPIVGFRKGLGVLPGLFLSFLSSNPVFSMLQWQYSLISVGGLFIAAAEGIRWFERHSGATQTPRTVAIAAGTLRTVRLRYLTYRSTVPRITGLVLAGLLAANVAFSPGLPLAHSLPNARPILAFQPASNFSRVEAIIQSIPARSSALASDYLFCHLENDPNAYPLLVYPFQGQMMALGHLPPGFVPRFVLIFASDYPWVQGLVPSFPGAYHLAGQVWTRPSAPPWPDESPSTAALEVELFVSS